MPNEEDSEKLSDGNFFLHSKCRNARQYLRNAQRSKGYEMQPARILVAASDFED